MRHCIQSVIRLSLLLVLSSAALAASVRPTGRSVPGEVLVRIEASASAAAVESIHSLADADDGKRLAGLQSGAAIWRLHSRSKNAEALVAALAKNPHVEYVEPNYILELVAAPNDPQYGQLWGLKNTGQLISGSTGFGGSDIDAESAWTITTGSSSVVVGVVDTGIDYTHPDLAANMWSNPGGKGNVACGAGTHGFNAITNSCDPMDDHDHGTHCAGTIGAVGNNNVGVAGVNWNVSLMALKFIASSGYGTTADAIQAIDFAVQAKIDGVNVRVLSNSWGGGAFSKALLDVINKANENDILFVAAAGNDGTSNDIYPHYPSNYATQNMISVAATENRDGLAYFSNYGATTVHLGAPGVSVLSTTPGNSYSYFSGTSMATPHVAGVAALLLAKTPGLSTAEVKETILESTDPLPSLEGRTVTGGRLNAAKVVGAPVSPEFSLTTSPTSRSVVRGMSTSYTITVTPSNGFAGAVALSVSGLPTGASGSFSPASTTSTSTLTVTTTNTTSLSSYVLTITGTGGGLTRNAFAGLSVVATPPQASCPQFSSPASYSASTPTAVATGDFNRDGRTDVAVTYVDSNAVAVRLGNGTGSLQSAFAYTVGTAPVAVATGDVNGDGRLDLAVANSGSDDVSILLASGEGSFASAVAYDAGSSPFAVAIADFNNDGKSDLVVANNAGSDVSILTGVGDGTFNAPVEYDAASGPFGLTAGDFDRDGNADLAVADHNAGKVSILLGNGDATFTAAVHYDTAAGPSGGASDDFNGDGKPDRAVSNYSAGNVSILIGNGDGTFQAAVHHAVGSGPYAVAAGDLNGDGKGDLVVANGTTNNVSILIGTGSGAFQTAIQHSTGGYEPNHVAIADFNGDGKTDFIVANTGYDSVAVILNQGVCSASCNAIAAPVHHGVSGTPYSVVAGDFNRDGFVDMAASARTTNSVSIVRGNGDGTFAAGVVVSAGTNPDSVTAGDFDGDGRLDLATANSGAGNVSVLLGNGDGTFATAVHYTAGTTPRSIATADFNRDGTLDLVVATAGSNSVAVLLGNGDGTFQSPLTTAAGTTPFFAASGDFNRDGKLDLAVANAGSNNVSILLGNGDGTFQSATHFAVGTSPRSIVVRDFNRNGKIDLSVTNAASNNVSVLLGSGDGTFAAAVHYTAGTSPVSVAAGDFNDDGLIDLGVANSGSNNVHVLVGDGFGTFAASVITSGGNAPAGIVAADVNRDGKPDLAVVAAGSASVAILRNTCPSPDLTVTKTHSGSFAQGSSGKTYSIVVKNSGSTGTAGVVSATDILPTGLTATAISGTGWTCTLATLTCTRNDVLAAGASYPAITVTVSVAGGAAATLTNVVNVSGGGELNTLNNSASDPTTITAVTDLIVVKSHLGSFAQGATGRTYTILVRNAGSLPTSGTVTVVDTLPTGLTIASLTGTGWTCTKANVTCTRSDVLAGGTVYPPITVTVNVAANAPASVINQATVSGGGQSNTSNDTAKDPTVIWAASTCGSFGAPAFYDSGSYPTDIAVGHLNGDSSPDLVVTNYYAGISVLLGKPDGSFHDPANHTLNSVSSVVLTDLNNDGKTDVVVVRASSTIEVLLGNGDGTLAAPVSYNAGNYPTGLTAADFNGDGNRDIAMVNLYGYGLSVFLGNGDGTLQGRVAYAAGLYFSDMAIADVDRNGTADLVVSASGDDVAILLGNGDGTFGAPTYPATTDGAGTVAVADFNQDGKPDLALPIYGAVTILLGNGDGTFQAGVDFDTNLSSSRSIVVEDLNGDGKTDMVIAGSSYSNIAILRGRGDGTFDPAVNQYVNAWVVQLALADFNADGRPDLAVASDYSDDVAIMLGGCGDLSITKSHSGNLVPGQTNAYYALTVKNSGAGVSTGTVTVQDLLPDGLTATYIWGYGWDCTLETLTCTTNYALSPGQSYDNITVTVSVDSDAPSTVINTATVSGGSDNNTANNTATDPTTIVQAADLVVAKTHGGMFAQGQTGRTYTIVVSNDGSVSTSGTVTVYDYLPNGLTATEWNGAGWNCVMGWPLSCSRTDALAGDSSYPPISLTVNVAGNAPSYVENYVTVSGGGELWQSTNNNSAVDGTPILGTPGSLSATALSGSQINLTWTAAYNSTAYEVYRSTGINQTWTLIATPLSNALSDLGVLPGKSYLYRVRAVASPGTIGAFSNVDVATAIVFTDDPLLAGTTTMKAAHINELRSAVNAMRTSAGLAPKGFTTPSLAAGSPILAVHWTELRTGLDQARAALGLLPIIYGETAAAGSTVNAAHIRDLRSGVK